MKKIISWFKYSPKIWLSLFVGWIAVLMASTPLINIDQSGALLICSVVIAEIFQKNGHQAFINAMGPGIRTHIRYVESKFDHSDGKCIDIIASQTESGKVQVNSNDWHLYHMALKKEFFGLGDEREWFYQHTFDRVESVIQYILVFHIVVGTVLWAFG